MNKRHGRIKRARLTKEERLAREASRLADLLVASDDLTAPPALLNDPRLAMARKFWEQRAARLAALGTLDDLSSMNLAMLCVYIADFIIAEDDILRTGFSVKVKTISGDRMPRENPSVSRRDHAAKMIMDLGRHFGLSKLDRLNLQRLRRGASDLPLFGEEPRPAPAPDLPDPNDEHAESWRRLLPQQTVPSGKVN